MFKIKSTFMTIITLLMVTATVFTQDVTLSFGVVNEDTGTMEILIENNQDVYGFQFNVTGINITGAEAGEVALEAAEAEEGTGVEGTEVEDANVEGTDTAPYEEGEEP